MFARIQTIRLDPSKEQEIALKRYAGARRFVWNWAVRRWIEIEANGARPKWKYLAVELRKRKQEDLEWLAEIPSAIQSNAIRDLDRAIHSGRERGKNNNRSAMPGVKKRRLGEKFTVPAQSFRFKDRKVRLPKIGWIRTREDLRLEGDIMDATVVRRAAGWDICVRVTETVTFKRHFGVTPPPVIGLHLTQDQAVLSDGTSIPFPDPFEGSERLWRKTRQLLNRQEKGSKRWKATRYKLQSIKDRASHVCRDFCHKLTTFLTENYAFIGVETLKSPWSTPDDSLGEIPNEFQRLIRQQLLYKADRTGTKLVSADYAKPVQCTCGIEYACTYMASARKRLPPAEYFERLAAARAVPAYRPASAAG